MIQQNHSRIWKRERSKHLFFILLLCSFGTDAWSEVGILASSTVGECSLTVEVNENSHTLRLRAHHPAYRGCHIDPGSINSVLDAAFSKAEPPKLENVYSSLSLGRLIDYPWICQYLATAAHRDRGWDSKKGKPVRMDINKFVAHLLFRKEVMAPIEAGLEKDGYKVTGVTVEKVLVGRFQEVPFYQGKMHPGWIPYDAQVWLRLGKN